MPVEDHRDDFDWSLLAVTRLRDCIAGEAAMQAAASAYIRRPEGMTADKDYLDYVKMVPFFDATGRTVEGLTGMAFFKDPTIDLPTEMDPIADDMTMDGVALPAFGNATLEEVVIAGRCGLMVDFPPADDGVRTQADAERANRRPFARIYKFEAAFNWTSGMVRNSRQLTQVRLLERELIQDGDEFTYKLEERIRVLQLVGNDLEGWTYRQRVFVKDEKAAKGGSQYIEDSTRGSVPKINNQPLEYIPFWFVNPNDQTDALVKPPLLGLANANIAHFNTSAQLERVLSFIGAPQPYGVGIDAAPGDDPITVGSAEFLFFPDANAKLDYLVCPADGTGPLERRLDRHEQQMALLGARMLSPDKKGVETAEAAGIHRQGEVSVLGACCDSVSAAISDALRVMAEWAGLPKPAADCFKIDKGFFENAMTGADAVSIMGLWQGGAIAFTDMIAKFKNGQIIAKGRTADNVRAEIQSGANSPNLPGLTGAA